MIDGTQEALISFKAAAAFLPKYSRPSYATWWRWWRRGIRKGVKLETVLVGGKRYTSEAALRRFIDALNAQPPAGASSSTPSRRERDIRGAEKSLADRGI